jgi:hypothetical protein
MANRPIHVVESGGDSTGLKEFADGADSGVQLPTGTIANRNSSASAGETRFNTDTKKLEYYDGAKWQSSTFINVDDAEYDGVITIESTQYSRDTSGNQPPNNGNWNAYGQDNSSTNWGWSQTLNNQTVSKFLPAGHPAAHSGATEADLRFGPVGYNSLETEKTQRSSPILELASNPPQTAMSNRYQNVDQHAGGLAFTVNTNDYFDNGYVPGGEFAGNRAFLSGITNFVEGNSVGYYGYDSPNNLLTFWNSTAVGGPHPVMSFGQAKYDNNNIGSQINFFTGGFTNPGSSGPNGASTSNKGTQIQLKAGSDLENSTTVNYEEIITSHNAINVSHHMSIAGGGGVSAYDDGSANYVMIFDAPTVSGRILQGDVNSNGYRLNKILIANGHGNTTDHRIIIRNNTGSNKTFKIDQDNMTCAKINSVKPAAITDYSGATSATAVTDIRHDSSFPAGGSDTTYTITPSGFIMFDLTIHGVNINGSDGTALFSNLQTAAI